MAKKSAKSDKKPSQILAIVLFPWTAFTWLVDKLAVLALFSVIISIIGLVIFAVVRLLVIGAFFGLVDLIFRTQARQAILSWFGNIFDNSIRPFYLIVWQTLVTWSDQLGITAVIFGVSGAASTAATEIARGLILFALFLLAGFAVYHLRIVRRITYALIELAVAVVAMWIAVDGMAGGDFSIKYFVALLTGLYIMVRGLQNIDEGLRINAVAERPKAGAAEAWVQLWEAMFYGPYWRESFSDRLAKFSEARKTISSERKRTPKPAKRQIRRHRN